MIIFFQCKTRKSRLQKTRKKKRKKEGCKQLFSVEFLRSIDWRTNYNQ